MSLLTFNEIVELVGPYRVPGYLAQYWSTSLEDRHSHLDDFCTSFLFEGATKILSHKDRLLKTA
jgi:hypothetical protein